MPERRLRAASTIRIDLSTSGRGRHQRRAVGVGPAVILRVRDLEPARAELLCELDEALDLVDIAAVDHRVHRQCEAEPRDLGGELHLGVVRTLQPRHLVGRGDVDALQRQLHMVEPHVGERRQHGQRAADARGDQVRVEPDLGAFGGDLDDVLARRRLAAERCTCSTPRHRCLFEHAEHGRRVHLGRALVELERVRAIGAMEWTAMRQLHQHADGVWDSRVLDGRPG